MIHSNYNMLVKYLSLLVYVAATVSCLIMYGYVICHLITDCVIMPDDMLKCVTIHCYSMEN